MRLGRFVPALRRNCLQGPNYSCRSSSPIPVGTLSIQDIPSSLGKQDDPGVPNDLGF